MTMKERLRSRVAELTSIIGVSGHEWDVAKYIFDAIKDDVDTIEQLPNGIIVATKKGAHPGPRVMVSAHMDEVGYEVRQPPGLPVLRSDRRRHHRLPARPPRAGQG